MYILFMCHPSILASYIYIYIIIFLYIIYMYIIYGNGKCFYTHREIFQNLFKSNLKSDCIYHIPIDLEQQTDGVRLLFQINRKIVNII